MGHSNAIRDHVKGVIDARSYTHAVSDAGVMEFKNVWRSNPAGTAGILLAYARAAVRRNRQGVFGAFSALDTPVSELLQAGADPVKLI